MTISDSYLEQQKQLHQNPNYGVASLEFAPVVLQIFNSINGKSLSDYGAGKKNLQKGLKELGLKNFSYRPYDPAFPEYGTPRKSDLVCCIDVLEHIEPPFLDAVLLELSEITRRLGFFTIHTKPALKVLPDGRNAHLIQEPTSWWLPKLCEHFEIVHLERVSHGFWVVVEPHTS